jgi:hypothetical protein
MSTGHPGVSRSRSRPGVPARHLRLVVDNSRQNLPGHPAKPTGGPAAFRKNASQRPALLRFFPWHGIRKAILDALVARPWI